MISRPSLKEILKEVLSAGEVGAPVIQIHRKKKSFSKGNCVGNEKRQYNYTFLFLSLVADIKSSCIKERNLHMRFHSYEARTAPAFLLKFSCSLRLVLFSF